MTRDGVKSARRAAISTTTGPSASATGREQPLPAYRHPKQRRVRRHLLAGSDERGQPRAATAGKRFRNRFECSARSACFARRANDPATGDSRHGLVANHRAIARCSTASSRRGHSRIGAPTSSNQSMISKSAIPPAGGAAVKAPRRRTASRAARRSAEPPACRATHRLGRPEDQLLGLELDRIAAADPLRSSRACRR